MKNFLRWTLLAVVLVSPLAYAADTEVLDQKYGARAGLLRYTNPPGVPVRLSRFYEALSELDANYLVYDPDTMASALKSFETNLGEKSLSLEQVRAVQIFYNALMAKPEREKMSLEARGEVTKILGSLEGRAAGGDSQDGLGRIKKKMLDSIIRRAEDPNQLARILNDMPEGVVDPLTAKSALRKFPEMEGATTGFLLKRWKPEIRRCVIGMQAIAKGL